VSQEYKKLIHGIQALRLKAELSSCPVLGGAGVRAFCYPHQLYVVNHILADTQIRHLLADEVGLGKTLESLMIMNALRLRNQYKLRVSIVVGRKELAKQWREEIRGRFPFPFWKNSVNKDYPNLFCNGNVFFEDSSGMEWRDESFEAQDDFMIFHPQNFDKIKEYLEPERCDLLILDEIHSFSDELLRFLTSRSADYQNVLVLSATPLLEEEKDRQLLRILAPEYAELSELQETPLQRLPTQLRILRSRRRNFPKALPQREPRILRIESLENDEWRFKKSRRLMQSMVRESLVTEENAALFIRRATIGGQTLIDRVDEYRRRYEGYKEELEEIRKRCSSEHGDVRLDALMDYLVSFFSEGAKRKLIIAAQDNPTIDYLAKQIERCLPEAGTVDNRTKVKVLQFRQERHRSEESDIDDETLEKREEALEKDRGIVEQFWTGDEQILIAHNDARESFNLQIADALVFYSLPWDPTHLEQWLGRISRLGLRKKKIVEIVAIVQREMIDEQIADLYDSLNIFHKPLDLEKNKTVLKDISQQIRRAVLYGNNELHHAGRGSIDVQESGDDLMHVVPQEAAYRLNDTIQLDVMEPVIRSSNDKNDFPKEDALWNWLGMLKDHEYCWLRSLPDVNYKNKPNPDYYRFSVIDKHNHGNCNIPVLNGEPLSGIPYILKRTQIQIPPRELVPIVRREQRYDVPLQFFNFGSLLHDGLMEHFAQFLRLPQLFLFSATFNREQLLHYPDAKDGEYLAGIASVKRKRREHSMFREKLLTGCGQSGNKTQEEMRQKELRRLENGLTADDRFLDLLFPGSLEILGFAWEDEKWKPLDDLRCIHAFLTCLPETVNKAETKELSDKRRDNLIDRLKRRPNDDTEKLGKRIKVVDRVEILEREMHVREKVLQIKIENLRRKIEEETNEQTIRLNYQPDKNRLEEQLRLVRRQWDIRKEYLTESQTTIDEPQIECHAIVQFDVKISKPS